jgi:hypothetical protein
MYFNTTGQSGQSLRDYRTKANSQDQDVLNVFKEVGGELNPESVHARLKLTNTKYLKTPLSSIRRSITALHQGVNGRPPVITYVKKTMGSMGREIKVYKLG